MNFSEIKAGQTAEVVHILTQDDVDRFIDLTGDNNKVHVSNSFGSPVVHGMLGASFISTVIGTKLPGDGAMWSEQSLMFLKPARVGDTLTIKAEVLEKNDRDRTLKIRTDIYNQDKVMITSGKALVVVMKEKEEKPKSILVRRTALVVGGMGGIGTAVAGKLTEDGFYVLVADRRGGDHTVDVMDSAKIDYFIDEIQSANTVDILINCASCPISDVKFEDITDDQMLHQLKMHLFSNFRLALWLVEGMRMRGYGKIIHIGSTVMDKPSGHWLPYIVAKEALWGLTKAMSYELAPMGIRVNMVSPSLIDTPLTADISPKTKMVLESQTPLRKTTTAEEVADIIAFLASEDGDAITGQNIRING